MNANLHGLAFCLDTVLRDVMAEWTGLTKSYLSRVERGLTAPFIARSARLAGSGAGLA
jgi:transcriptional regulator with XRE-family HTH domain